MTKAGKKKNDYNRYLVDPKTKICDCGNRAAHVARNDFVCERCYKIENMFKQYTRTTPKQSDPDPEPNNN